MLAKRLFKVYFLYFFMHIFTLGKVKYFRFFLSYIRLFGIYTLYTHVVN